MRTRRPNHHLAVLGLVGAVCLAAPAAADDTPFAPARDVMFVPTPPMAVIKMLELAGAGPGDVIYDLGSGDGRILVTAVRDFGVRKAVGVDIDPALVQKSLKNAEDAGVADRVQVVVGNFFDFDFSEATVLTLYLLPSLNLELRPRILELRPGTRVVSHDFHMEEWRADDFATVQDEGGAYLDVYMWVVPARVEGAWQWKHGGNAYRLSLAQSFQKVSGELHAFGRRTPIREAHLRGNELRFETDALRDGKKVPISFAGTMSDGVMEGTFQVDGKSDKVILRRSD